MSRHQIVPAPIQACVAATLILTFTPPAACEESATSQAQLHFQRATDHYAAGRYQEALDEYQRAHELVPHPSSLFNMARCHENLGDSPEALARYREALDGTDDAAERADIQGRIERILQRPVRIFVTSEPAAATILVDAREAPEPQVTPATVELTPGPHRLILTAEGHQPTSHRIMVEVGQEQPVSISLTPLPSGAGAEGDCPEQTECPTCRRTSYDGNRFHISLGLPTFFPLHGEHADIQQTGIGINLDGHVSIGHVIFGGSLNVFPLGESTVVDDIMDGATVLFSDVEFTQTFFLINVSLQAGYVWAWDVVAIALMGGVSAIIDLSSRNVRDDEIARQVDFDGSLGFDKAQLHGMIATSFEFFVRRWVSLSLDVRLAMGGTFEDPRFQIHALIGMSLDFHI